MYNDGTSRPPLILHLQILHFRQTRRDAGEMVVVQMQLSEVLCVKQTAMLNMANFIVSKAQPTTHTHTHTHTHTNRKAHTQRAHTHIARNQPILIFGEQCYQLCGLRKRLKQEEHRRNKDK